MSRVFYTPVFFNRDYDKSGTSGVSTVRLAGEVVELGDGQDTEVS